MRACPLLQVQPGDYVSRVADRLELELEELLLPNAGRIPQLGEYLPTGQTLLVCGIMTGEVHSCSCVGCACVASQVVEVDDRGSWCDDRGVVVQCKGVHRYIHMPRQRKVPYQAMRIHRPVVARSVWWPQCHCNLLIWAAIGSQQVVSAGWHEGQ